MPRNHAAVSDFPLAAEANSLTTIKIVSEPIEKLSLVDQIHAHVILKKLADAIKTRLDELRDPLLNTAESKGEPNESGKTLKYNVDGNSICAEHKQSSSPSEDKIKELLKSKELSVFECFDEQTILVFNPSKLSHLVDIGKLTKEEVIAAYPPPTTSLRVYPSKELKEAVEGLGLRAKALQEESKALPEKK